MTRTHQPVGDAREAVRAAVEYLDEEERWVLLQRWLERETAGMSQAANRSLRLETLRSIVCPRLGDREWDSIVREHRKIEWAGELRRANARVILPVHPSLEPHVGLTPALRGPRRSRPDSPGEAAW
jgi:hypothetical protein